MQHQNQGDSSILIEDSDGEADNVIDEPMEECYEIIIPDDDIVTDINNDVAVTSTVNPSLEETLDADGDKAFASLIVEELRKMAPTDQQKFKRNVTQLLYS